VHSNGRNTESTHEDVLLGKMGLRISVFTLVSVVAGVSYWVHRKLMSMSSLDGFEDS